MNERQIADVMHFLDLARRGKSPGASSGEKRAYRLACWLKKSGLNDVVGLDASAVSGFCNLIRAADGNMDVVDDLLAGF